MKTLLGVFAVVATLLFAGYSTTTPAAAASPAQTSASHEKAGVNTDISAQYYYPRRRYVAPRRYYRPRYYVAPRPYIVPRYYAPPRYYGYGW